MNILRGLLLFVIAGLLGFACGDSNPATDNDAGSESEQTHESHQESNGEADSDNNSDDDEDNDDSQTEEEDAEESGAEDDESDDSVSSSQNDDQNTDEEEIIDSADNDEVDETTEDDSQSDESDEESADDDSETPSSDNTQESDSEPATDTDEEIETQRETESEEPTDEEFPTDTAIDTGSGIPTDTGEMAPSDTGQPGACDFTLVGWATQSGSTTGGEGGETVTVSDASSLENALSGDTPRIIEFSGSITGEFRLGSNKTLRGTESGATINGSLVISGASNIILQNFNVNAGSSSNEDGISITEAAHHIWVDHLAVYDAADGNLDIKRESDFITISWTKFYYNRGGDHRFSNLIGHSDDFTDDAGELNVTLHHCWWGEGVTERMPRIRFGKVHSYNNYFASPGNNYCIRAAKASSVLIENNYFDNVNTPHEINNEDGSPASVTAIGNVYDNTSGAQDEQGQAFTPPYSYSADDANAVPDLVRNCAGPQ